MARALLRTGLLAGTVVAAAVSLGIVVRPAAPVSAAALPQPALDEPADPGRDAVAVFAGGCFWGVEAVFEHVKGVKSVTSGYSGGRAISPSYEDVSSGTTGHAESVRIVYDPSQVTYGDLLRVFFSVAHDPTQVNRQGPDVGAQYRSIVFYVDEQQRRIAQAYVAQLTNARVFSHPIATQLVPFQAFYPAEAYHQGYARHHPYQPYIMINDAPKVERLRKQLPQLYREPAD